MSRRKDGFGPIELAGPWSADEAMVAWRLCTELADRIWERHEPELLERLLAEERGERCERCERHPWRREPCAACIEGENLELAFEDVDQPY